MKEQLLLLSLAVMAFIVLFQHRNSGSDPLAYALAGSLPTPTNLFSNLYEKATLLFDKELTQDEVKGWFKEGFEKYKGEVKTIVDGIKDAADKKASSEEITQLKAELEKKISEVQDYAEEVELKANRLKENEPVNKKSLIELAEDGMVKMKSAMKEKGFDMKGIWKNSPGAGQEIEIDLKAVSNMTTGYALTGANANIMRAFDTEPGVAKDPMAPLFITDLISTGTTEAQTIYWVERVLIEGGAAQVAEAGLFPQISSKYSKFSANAKKTAAFAKITEESVEDVEYMLSEVESEITSGPSSIRVQLENQLLTGDGNGENHKGLFTYATQFAVPAGFDLIVSPTNYDAAQAAILQVAKANFMPTHMLVNPSDLVNMQLTKDANGNYVMPPFMGPNGMVIAGVRIASNNRIAEGSYLIGEMKRAKLFIKRQLTLKFFDQNQDDPLYDLRTITGSVRGIFRLKGPDAKGFVKGTFNGTKELIKA